VARDAKRVCLALQGGGTHGAFTWGVLDRLAEDGRLDIAGLSATSAGAVNAAAWAHGYADGGAAGARARMTAVWEAIAATPNAFAPGAWAGPFRSAFFGWMDAFG